MEGLYDNYSLNSIFEKTFHKNYFTPLKPVIKRYAHPIRHPSPGSISIMTSPVSVKNYKHIKYFSSECALPKILPSRKDSIERKNYSESPNHSILNISQNSNGFAYISMDSIRKDKLKNKRNLFFGSPRKHKEPVYPEKIELLVLENKKKVILPKTEKYEQNNKVMRNTFVQAKYSENGESTGPHKKQGQNEPLIGWENNFSRISFNI